MENMKERFYFMLTDKMEGTTFRDLGDIYEAVKTEDGYTVYWSEYGEIFDVNYTDLSVYASLVGGYWKEVSEEEIEEIIKGH